MKTDTLLVPITQLKIGLVPAAKRGVPEQNPPAPELFDFADLTMLKGETPTDGTQGFTSDIPAAIQPSMGTPAGITIALNQAGLALPQANKAPENPPIAPLELPLSAANKTPEIASNFNPQPEQPPVSKVENPIPNQIAVAKVSATDPSQLPMKTANLLSVTPAWTPETGLPLPVPLPLPAKGQVSDSLTPAAPSKSVPDLVSKIVQAPAPVEFSKPVRSPETGPKGGKPEAQTAPFPLNPSFVTAVAPELNKTVPAVQIVDTVVKSTLAEPTSQPAIQQTSAPSDRAEPSLLPTIAALPQSVQKPTETLIQPKAAEQATQPNTTPQIVTTEKQTAPNVLAQQVNPTPTPTATPVPGLLPTVPVSARKFSSNPLTSPPVERAPTIPAQQQPHTTPVLEPKQQPITSAPPSMPNELAQSESVEPLTIPDVAPIETRNFTSLTSSGQPAPNAQPPGFVMRALQTITQAALTLQDRPIELTLNPEELGRVRLTLNSAEGAMAVSITVERPDTLDLLRRNIDILAQQLRDIGYQNLSFSFAGQGGDFGGDNAENPQTQTPAAGGDAQPIDATSMPLRINLDGTNGVDIRL